MNVVCQLLSCKVAAIRNGKSRLDCICYVRSIKVRRNVVKQLKGTLSNNKTDDGRFALSEQY